MVLKKHPYVWIYLWPLRLHTLFQQIISKQRIISSIGDGVHDYCVQKSTIASWKLPVIQRYAFTKKAALQKKAAKMPNGQSWKNSASLAAAIKLQNAEYNNARRRSGLLKVNPSSSSRGCPISKPRLHLSWHLCLEMGWLRWEDSYGFWR